VRFNARAGTTYYIAVDGKPGPGASPVGLFSFNSLESQGFISLQWAFRPSGVFRFASEEVDIAGWIEQQNAPMPLPLYQCTQLESFPATSETAHDSYYQFDPAGVLVTVTRVGGSAGRMFVDYFTQDGTAV